MFAPCAGGLTRTTRPRAVVAVRAGRVEVQSIDLLVNRLPTHEFAIRRLYVRDPEFRAVCDDYGEVQRALEHWRATDQAAPGRVAEYRQMLEELEAEALAFLNASGDT
jgi:outer membrane protein assembly factor BamD (BamD/ComL family)